MADRIVPLGVREVEDVLAEMEQEFSEQNIPTLLRLRAATIIEELFSALRELNDDGGMLRCTFPTPGTMHLQYRSRRGALNPDLKLVKRLASNPCTDGVSVAFREGRCIISVEQ